MKKGKTYYCDKEGCSASITPPHADFKEAWEYAKKQGWRALKVDGKWYQWCSWVHVKDIR